MDIKDILSVGLTTEDFDLLMKGIDAIPDKEKAEGALQHLMTAMLSSLGNASRTKEVGDIFERKMKDLEKRSAAQKDDLTILKSKLILLKRLLLSNAAVSMTNEILQNPPPLANR